MRIPKILPRGGRFCRESGGRTFVPMSPRASSGTARNRESVQLPEAVPRRELGHCIGSRQSRGKWALSRRWPHTSGRKRARSGLASIRASNRYADSRIDFHSYEQSIASTPARRGQQRQIAVMAGCGNARNQRITRSKGVRSPRQVGSHAFLSDPSRPIERTLQIMMRTRHLGDRPHDVVASTARKVPNKAENERSGVLSTAMSFLGLYRDPIVAKVTARCGWMISDLVECECPASLYLVVPPSDISRH
jgi:Type IV secretory system Conjugative DNA transfer